MPVPITIKTATSIAIRSWCGRSLARQSDGTLWCVYQYGTVAVDRGIYCSYSTDEGQTWTEETVYFSAPDLGTHQYAPSIAIDSQDNIHIVWEGKGWGTNVTKTNIQYRKRTSAGWQDVEGITDVAYDQGFSSVAIDSQDNIHVVWRCYNWGELDWDIGYRKRTSVEWGAIEQVTTGEIAHAFYPDIVVDSEDNLHVLGRAYGIDNPVAYGIVYVKRVAGGWGAQEYVVDVPASQSYSDLVIDSEDNIHVVFAGTGWGVETNYTNIQYRKRDSEGGAWEVMAAVTDKDNYQHEMTMALDSNDNIHVTWIGKGWGVNTTKKNIQYRMFNGTIWGAQTAITDREADQGEPSLIWARWPVVGGAHTNQPKSGFACVFAANGVLEYYPGDPTWEAPVKAFPQMTLI